MSSSEVRGPGMMNQCMRTNGTVANRIITHPNDALIKFDAAFPEFAMDGVGSKVLLASPESP
jgi:hypothetical protein